MSNIAKIGFNQHELDALNKLSENQKLYVAAKNEQKIINIERGEAVKLIFSEIAKTIELSGENKKYALENDQLKNVSKFIYEYILDQHKGLTLSELRNAFKLGISNEFGDFIGFGSVTFTKFIKGYNSSSKREQALKEWMKLQGPATTDKPITKVFEQNMEVANYFFKVLEPKMSERIDTVLNHDEHVMHLPSVFDFLFKTYKITFTQETSDMIRKKAKVRYNNFLVKSELKKKDPKGYEAMVKAVINESNPTFSNYLKVEALIFITLKLKEHGKTYDSLKLLK